MYKAEVYQSMTQPTIAIVILNWNGKKFLEKFLPSVLAAVHVHTQHTLHKKIIIADNASTDDSVSFLQAHYPQIEIIQNYSNEGFAKGYNMALKQVEADYYVLLNSDVEVTPGFIEPVIDLMERDRAIAACQPKLLAYTDKTMFEYAGACGGWIDFLGYPFMRGRIFDICEKDTGQYDDAAPCFWASGAALFVRAAVFHELQGFDEFFFAHQEEIDLCWRAQLAGYKIYVQPSSVVYHVGGGTLPQGNSLKTFLNFRNNLVMLAKNLSIANAVWKIPARLMLDALSAWRELWRGDHGYFFAIAKAHVHFFGWLLGGKKQSIFPKKKGAKPAGYFKGSVIWGHFLLKKKTFSEIIGSK